MKKIYPFYLFLFGFLGLLLLRLFQLTIIEGSINRQSADTQRIRLRKISAPRGMIFDRKGKPLVRNIPIFNRCSLTENTCSEISRQEALRLEAEGRDTELLIGAGRSYPYGKATAHLLGYLGEVTEEEIKNKSCKSFSLKDLVGRTGIEEQFDCLLQGIDGGELMEVNTEGKTLRKIGKREAVVGQDITLSIDIDLQIEAYKALEGRRGALVASVPLTGEILVLVSSPGFDKAQAVLNDPDQPLFNRAISGAYPPGSTFKLVTAAAGLEEKKITSQTLIEDTGVITVGAFRYTNWYFTQYGKTEGKINVVEALKRSTDTYFYRVGESVGASKLIDWAKKFGLGKSTGLELPSEISGSLPNPSSGEWYLGNTYHLSIGQGALWLTPLQVNQMTSVIASGGKWCQPHIRVKEPFDSVYTDPPAGGERAQGKQASERPVRRSLGEGGVKGCHDVGLKKETIGLVTEGMKEACSPGGTAFPLFNFKVPVACKTGTAEFGDPKGKTHAWLTAFAPVDKPEIVVTALVEEGGEGSRVAAPIVKKVLEAYFSSN